MKKMFSILLASMAVVSLTSCTNWLIRKECEKVNWFQHGYDVAMEGRRLTGDPQVDRCRKAEFDLPEQQLDVGFKSGMSNYCKPEIVYATGKKGDFFNLDLCDSGQGNALRARHAEGVKAYCAVDNGFNAGSSGKKYQGLCPPELEKGFLKEYKRGRKSYLSARITNADREAHDLDSKILEAERERTSLSYRYNLVPAPRTITERVYNPASGTYVEQSRTEDPGAAERQRINSEIQTVTSRIQETRNRQDALKKQMSDDQMELATLE